MNARDDTEQAHPDTPRPDTVTPQHSLFVRVVVGIVLVTAIINGALFIGIDQVVSRQFDDLHQERLDRVADQVDKSIRQELNRLASLTGLLVNDADLVNSTYYHLYLEGEQHHPAAAVDRQAQAFQLERVSLWAASDGGEIAATGRDHAAPFPPQSGMASAGGTTRVIEEGGRFWLAAQAPLEHNSVDIAWLVAARPLSELMAALQETYSARIETATEGPPESGTRRIYLGQAEAQGSLAFDVTAPDTVARALGEVKQLLTITLAIAAILLAVTLMLVLRTQLRPLSDLIGHLGHIAHGNFGYQAPVPTGPGEFSRLVRAFNAMSSNLARLRDMERRLQHQEQLSAIGRVAARVAHDINNPLTVISSATATLQRDRALTEHQRELADMIDHHCQRCSRTVQELLEYGRPVKPRALDLDLHALASRVIRRQRDARGMPIKLSPPTGENLPSVEADPTLIEQMLDNLINNAAEAAPGHEVEVHLTAAGTDLQLEIVDSGPGFSDAAREHLFEPFFTTKKGGTGLGMASVLGVVRAHDGDIDVGKGPGGHVRIRLPRRGSGGARETLIDSHARVGAPPFR